MKKFMILMGASLLALTAACDGGDEAPENVNVSQNIVEANEAEYTTDNGQ